MKIKEKALRHALAEIGPSIRAGHWGVQRYTVGDMPRNGYIKKVCADIENSGTCSAVRIYAVGDAQEPRDCHGETADITAPIERYIMRQSTWSEMIQEALEIIETHTQESTTE